ncbi:hypothetical protein ACP275_06G129700 [Erythranthe tilingii]
MNLDIHIFLERAKDLFDMYIYTLVPRSYAIEVVQLINTHVKDFKSKDISREESTQID